MELKKNELMQNKIDCLRYAAKNGRVISGPGYDGPLELRTIGPERITQSIQIMKRSNPGKAMDYFLFHSSVDEDGREVMPGVISTTLACYSADENKRSLLDKLFGKKKTFRLHENLRMDDKFDVVVSDVVEADKVLRERALSLAKLLAEESGIPVDCQF